MKRPCRPKSSKTFAKMRSVACSRAPRNPLRQTSFRFPVLMAMTKAGAWWASKLTAKSSAAFPRRAASWNSIRARLADWGWREFALPTYIKSHVHPRQSRSRSNDSDLDFSLAGADSHAQRQREVARRNRAHKSALDSSRVMRRNSACAPAICCAWKLRLVTYVVRAWVTEGIRPGIVACSHHMGRWKLTTTNREQRQMMATVKLDHEGSEWGLKREKGRRALRVKRSGHAAHLVERCRRASEHDFSGSSRSDFGNALLAPGGARDARPSRATSPASIC